MTIEALKTLRNRVAGRIVIGEAQTSGPFFTNNDSAMLQHLLCAELLARDKDMLAILVALIERAGE